MRTVEVALELRSAILRQEAIASVLHVQDGLHRAYEDREELLAKDSAREIERQSILDAQRTGEVLDPKKSRGLVRALLSQHARPEYTCRFRWGQGSIAFWDNRAAQHYAVSDYFPHKRVLRRVTVSGDRPFYRPIASD